MDAVIRFAAGYDLYDGMRYRQVPATIACVIAAFIHVGWLSTFVMPAYVIHANVFGSNIDLTMHTLAWILNAPRAYLLTDARERALRTEFGQRQEAMAQQVDDIARQVQIIAEEQRENHRVMMNMMNMLTGMSTRLEEVDNPGAPYRRLLANAATRSED